MPKMMKNFEGFNMNDVMTQGKVGRGYSIAMLDRNSNSYESDRAGINKYDVVLAYGGRGICTMSTGCVGIKSAGMWQNNAIKFMKRVIHLMDDIDKVSHNLMCYSANLTMDKPKGGFEEEFEQTLDKYNMLKDWLEEMVDKMTDTSYNPTGTKSTLAHWLHVEFSEYLDYED